MPQLFKNNAYSALAANLTAGATSLALASGTGSRFPSPTGGDFFLLTLSGVSGGSEASWEIVKVTGRSGDSLTIERAQEGTADVSWPSGTPVDMRITAGLISDMQDALSGSQQVQIVSYDNRATLRSLNPTADALALVEGLGLFRWYSGSVEIDDDATCFATTSGRWLIETISFDLADSLISETIKGRILRATLTTTFTSITTNTWVTSTVNVPGALVGSSVFVSLQSGGPTSSQFSVMGEVSSNNVVTVKFFNPSASTNTVMTNPSVWQITVIK